MMFVKVDPTIRKTCPCNVYPIEPHFYMAKLEFAGVYLFFLYLLQNIDCGYSLEPPRRGGSNVYPQSTFWSKNKKNTKIFPVKKFILQPKKFLYNLLHGRDFVMYFVSCSLLFVAQCMVRAKLLKISLFFSGEIFNFNS